jgi:hypothetical protein
MGDGELLRFWQLNQRLRLERTRHTMLYQGTDLDKQ